MKTNLHEVNKGFKIIGNRPRQVKQLKESYQQLKDEGLIFEEGCENELLQRLKKQLSARRIEIIRKNAAKMNHH